MTVSMLVLGVVGYIISNVPIFLAFRRMSRKIRRLEAIVTSYPNDQVPKLPRSERVALLVEKLIKSGQSVVFATNDAERIVDKEIQDEKR